MNSLELYADIAEGFSGDVSVDFSYIFIYIMYNKRGYIFFFFFFCSRAI